MIQVKSPYCRGSGNQSTGTAKRARCNRCGNLVRVDDGKLCEHWWSRQAHRYTSTKFKRGNQ